MSQEIQLQDAADEMRGLQQERELKQDRVRALIGDGNGRITGNRGVPWIFCRLNGDINQLIEAYNGTPLVPVENTGITLLRKYQGGRVAFYEVERLSNDVAYPNYTPGGVGGVAAHHLSHEGTTGGGWDLVNVYPLNMTMLRCDAQATPDLTLSIAPGMYAINSVLCYYAGGNSPAFTPPGSGSEYQVLSINAGGVLTITPNGLTYPPFSMSIPADNIPIAAPYLTAGQTAITQADLLFDPRPFLSLGGSGSTDALALLDSDGTTLLDSDGNMLDANT